MRGMENCAVNFMVRNLAPRKAGPPERHPCPRQLSLPLGFVVTSQLIEGDDQSLGLHSALVPGRLDARRPDA